MLASESHPIQVPLQFVETVHRVFGDKGRVWLPLLPAILARCRERWNLAEGVICPAVSMNYIEFTTTSGGEAVALKVGVPHEELFTEMEALALYNGRGAARLLDADRELGAILMQRAVPGTMLRQVGDNRKQTHIAASVMKALPVAVPGTHSMPHFSRWTERAFRLTRTEWDPEERMRSGLHRTLTRPNPRRRPARRSAPREHPLGRGGRLAGHRPQGRHRPPMSGGRALHPEPTPGRWTLWRHRGAGTRTDRDLQHGAGNDPPDHRRRRFGGLCPQSRLELRG